jgi:hypothetical protein
LAQMAAGALAPSVPGAVCAVPVAASFGEPQELAAERSKGS